MEFLVNPIRICPAVMLAQRRTERVMGRIIWLTVSITVMNWERGRGVDRGTICLKKDLVFKNIENKIKAVQKGKANLNENIICLVSVYT